MKRIVTGIGALLAGAAPVLAGGIERAPQSLAPLFENGNYAELSFGGVNPSVRGHDYAPGAVGGPYATGDVAQGYGFFGLAYKHQFTPNLSGAIIVEQPFGADIRYQAPPDGSLLLGGTLVEVNSTTYTALLRYKFDNNVSVHGGIRGSHADGRVGLNGAGYLTTAGYNLDIDGAWGVGWVAGVAYEMPEIAARVSLTYNSPIEHDFDMTETGGPLPVAFKDKYTVKTPRSWTLEGQTGIAEDTLLFGSIRWVKWSEFKVDNFLFPIATAAGEIPLVEVEDTTTYTIGIGRKFTENWSGSVSFLYEPKEGKTVSPLAPVNGRKAVTLAAIYTMDNIKITTGINYTKLGDATLGIGPSDNKTEVAKMDDSEAWGVGVRIGYSF
ncbi:OmpP1/FadL family transporter [Paracoccus aminovorans]|uniref:OmpP1/FadL family transporter n=1 Tax=Paracoccus aminovorans TaxID=34004 RepID=UPI002B263935|nr:outer membrane protein transport protein [Paracoccus aminovorans]